MDSCVSERRALHGSAQAMSCTAGTGDGEEELSPQTLLLAPLLLAQSRPAASLPREESQSSSDSLPAQSSPEPARSSTTNSWIRSRSWWHITEEDEDEEEDSPSDLRPSHGTLDAQSRDL